MSKKVKEIICEVVLIFVVMMGMLAILFLRGEFESYGAEIANEYQGIIDTATEEDLYALECVVYWEAVRADCDYTVNKAVVETVMNRVLSPNYPNTIEKVCKQKGHFVCRPIPQGVSMYAWEQISDAIEGTVNYGREILPSTDYLFFATKKQSCAKDHVWVGDSFNGTPIKGTGMYFGKSK